MWYVNSECKFSLNVVGNADASASGECTIEGHKSIGNDWETSEIIFYFSSNPTHAVKFEHQIEDWGPVEYMTDDRYYSVFDGVWMWQKPDTYCEVCDDVPDWSVINFNMQSTDFTYGYDTETIGYNDDVVGGDLYNTGEGYYVPGQDEIEGVDEDGNMIVAPDSDDVILGLDEDGNQIVSPTDYYGEGYYDYYESFSYSTTV